jgi:TetR/AcrR family fatty acid metabolism transcriptional regulator
MILTERQIEILHETKELIGEKGIQNFTIKNLASKMSFSEPAIYRHFKDKTEILTSLLKYNSEIINTQVGQILDSKENTLTKFEKILSFKLSHIERNPSIVMIVFAENSYQNCERLSKIVAKIMKRRTERIIKLLKEGKKNNEIRNDINTEQLAKIIQGGIRITILSWKLSGFKTSLSQEGKKLWITIQKLIKK